jgi:hypothetical protein
VVWHAGAVDIDELWQAALDDAGIDAKDAMLFVRSGPQAPDGCRGKCWPRNDVIDDESDCRALGECVDRANSDAARAVRRVAVWIAGRTDEGIAAAIRHELEHSHQFEWGRSLLNLHGEAEDLLRRHAGGLTGSSELYNKIPMEVDANRAASLFVRNRFDISRIDSLIAAGDPDVALFREDDPPEPIGDALRVRMKAFVDSDGAQLADEFARRDRRGGSS